MENKPIVSVIIPVKAASEKQIISCFELLQKQTLRSFEVLVVCDSSEDTKANRDFIAKFSMSDSRFRMLIEAPGQGLGGARNLGIESAKSPFIAFVDIDDHPSFSFLESLINNQKNNDSDIVICGFARHYPDSHVETWLPPFKENRSGSDCLGDVLTWKINNTLWNKLFKRGLFTDIQFPVACGGEDFAILPWIFLKASRVSSLQETLYEYCIIPTSRSHALTDFDYYCSFLFLKKRYCLSLSIQKPEIVQKCLKEACGVSSRACLFAYAHPQVTGEQRKREIDDFIYQYKKLVRSSHAGKKATLVSMTRFYFYPIFLLWSSLQKKKTKTAEKRYQIFEDWWLTHE